MFVGAPRQANVRPKFQIKKLEGVRIASKIKYVTKKNKKNKEIPIREDYTEEVEAGYLVAFPAGHTIRLGSFDAVRKLGFDNDADLVDMDTGELIEKQEQVDLFTMASRQVGMEDIA